MKKVLALVLCLMLAAVCACTAGAEEEKEEFVSGDYKYTLDDDGGAVITGYTGTDAKLTIPEALDGHPVTGIGDLAFYWCDSLTSVVIPDGVTSIGGTAFGGCTSLASVTIPDSVTSIGINPFINCDSLTDIIVSPENPALAVTDGVLFEKTGMTLIRYPMHGGETSYSVPQGVTAIGENAFYNCVSLASVAIPDSVTSIGNTAFFGCPYLASVTIPDSVTAIGKDAFTCCRLLTLTVPEGSYAEQYCVDNSLNYQYAGSAS